MRPIDFLDAPPGPRCAPPAPHLRSRRIGITGSYEEAQWLSEKGHKVDDRPPGAGPEGPAAGRLRHPPRRARGLRGQ